MNNWLIAILANISLAYMLSRLVVYINIGYRLQGKDDNIIVTVCLFHNMILYRMTIPVIKLIKAGDSIWLESEIKVSDATENSQIGREKRFVSNAFKIYLTHPKRLSEAIRLLRHYTRLYQRLINSILPFLQCERFYWKTIFGSEDAAMTGVMVGAFWVLKRMFITALGYRIGFSQEPVVAVVPEFNRNQLDIDLQCIFSIRLGNVINAISCLFYPKGKGGDG